MLAFVANADVTLITLRNTKALVGSRTMIDKGPYWYSHGQFRHSANVIAMIVSNQQIIDLADARSFRHGRYTRGVPFSWETGIDEHGFPGGGDKKRRLPALDINEVDVQCIMPLRPDDRREQKCRECC